MVRAPLAPAVLLLLFGALLAGCSSPGPSQPEASATGGPQTTTVLGQLREPVYTDTVHLLRQPAFTPNPPPDGAPLRIAIPPFLGRSDFSDWWTVELKQDTQSIHGQAVLYGEVTGTVLNDPFPTAGGCFWQFGVSWDDLDLQGSSSSPCGVEAPTVQPGIRQLVFPLDATGPWEAGTVLRFEFYTQDGARSPGAEINLLTASAQYDSTLTLEGLHLPVGPGNLLPAQAGG